MYGKSQLAHTGAAAAVLAGVGVLGVTIPYLAIASTGLVLLGAIALRMSGKRRAARSSIR